MRRSAGARSGATSARPAPERPSAADRVRRGRLAGGLSSVVAAVLVATTVGAGSTGTAATASAQAPPPPFPTLAAAARADVIDDALASRLRVGDAVPVLVSFESLAGPVLALPAPGSDRHETGTWTPPSDDALRAAQARVEATAGSGVRIERRYRNLPMVAARLDRPGALRLLNAVPGARVHEDIRLSRQLPESLRVIRQPPVAASGWTGAGTVVGVIDSGLDWTNPAFGTCPVVGAPGCRVAELIPDFTPDDGVLDDDLHGTTVAAVVAAVAPDARMIGADVFDDVGAPLSAVAAAVDAMIERRRAGANLRAINISLGMTDSFNTGPCPDLLGLQTAMAWGITVVVASGNSAFKDGVYHDGVSNPACVSGVISVGATYDAHGGIRISWGNPTRCIDWNQQPNLVVCASQNGPSLTVHAPGALISALGRTVGGTSFAAPHVTGAVAVLAQHNPALTTAQLAFLLRETGSMPDDRRRVNEPTQNQHPTVVDLLTAIRNARPMPNDDRATPALLQPVEGVVAPLVGSTLFSTLEGGEPPEGQGAQFGSLWYRVRAPVSGWLRINSCQSQSERYVDVIPHAIDEASGEPLEQYGAGGQVLGCEIGGWANYAVRVTGGRTTLLRLSSYPRRGDFLAMTRFVPIRVQQTLAQSA